MNFEKAVKIIRERLNWKNATVDKKNKTITLFWGDGSEWKTLSAREAISFARCRTHDYSETPKQIVKEASKGKDRTAARDAINKGDFDSIPKGKRMNEEDLWSWD